MLIDTHAHLTDKAFADNVQEIIAKAKECTVTKIITSGFDYDSSVEAVEFAKKYQGIYASVGVYPENIYEYNDEIEHKLEALTKNSKVVAIGEIGLQYTEDMPEREKQKEIFLRQLSLASRCKLPVVIHCRDAYGDMIELLKKNKSLLSQGGTLHCFGGSYEIAKDAIKLGLYISVGGVSTFKNAINLKETLTKLPLENMILETDCPYLAPHPYRGKLNMPSYIPTIAENLAKLKDVSVEEVAKVTSYNAEKLFKFK